MSTRSGILFVHPTEELADGNHYTTGSKYLSFCINGTVAFAAERFNGNDKDFPGPIKLNTSKAAPVNEGFQ